MSDLDVVPRRGSPSDIPEIAPERLAPTGPHAPSRRPLRWRMLAALSVVVALVAGTHVFAPSRTPRAGVRPHQSGASTTGSNPRLGPEWDGDGEPVTLAFGGDVNFPEGSILGDRLATDPATALGPGVPVLLAGVNLSMVNFESALTNGTCPQPQPKEYVFWAPPSALTAFRDATVSLVTEANNHGQDCGEAGLQMALAYRARARYTVLGIGQNSNQAFQSYQTVINGERIGIIAATQVIDSDLMSSWTATPTHAGLASAYSVDRLVGAVEAARRVDDTVIVFLHWGVQLDDCPDPLQEPLATVLVRAGADIVIGSHAHVLLGGGYLGSAYVDYGLGNFAFYNDPYPTDQSGSLIIRVTGRHIDYVGWRPAVIENEIPVPLTGAAASAARQQWAAHRSCTDLSVNPSRSLASPSSETGPPSPALVQYLSS